MEAFALQQWDATIRYFDLPGENPPRVYLHGLGITSESYLAIAQHPRLAGTRSLLVDFLGHSASDHPLDFSYSLEDHALAVGELLHHLGLGPYVIIGHSFGGSVAIALAGLRPELVARLIVEEGNLDAGGGGFSQAIAVQSEQEFVETGHDTLVSGLAASAAGDPILQALEAGVRSSAPHAIHRGAVGLIAGTQPTLRERFYQFDGPRVFIYGEKSLGIEDNGAPDVPPLMPLIQHGVHTLIVPNAGHVMMLDNPDGYAEILRLALTV